MSRPSAETQAGVTGGATAPAVDPLDQDEDEPLGVQGAERCSTRSRALGESMVGTASTVRSWLLLEQPGPWEPTALASRRLPAGMGAELARRATRHRVRIVLIRRHGRTLAGAPPVCFVASSRPVGSWLGEVSLDTPGDVLDLDLASLAADGRLAPARTIEGPLFCVCTHGRHDPCCAERGRPLAASLAAGFPEQTWEVSHIGGDRFAGNVVCLPDGDYLGWVPPEDAVAMARDYVDGDYWLAHLRGRSPYAPVVQAAEVLLRQRLGVTGRRAVRVIRVDRARPQAVVRMMVEGYGVLDARVRTNAATPGRRLTCTSTSVEHPPTYELVDVV